MPEIALKYDDGRWSRWRDVEATMPAVVSTVVCGPCKQCRRYWPACRRGTQRRWYRQLFLMMPAVPASAVNFIVKHSSFYCDREPPSSAVGAFEAWCREAIVEVALPRHAALLSDIGRGEESSFEVLADMIEEHFAFRPAFRPMMSAVLGLLTDPP